MKMVNPYESIPSNDEQLSVQSNIQRLRTLQALCIGAVLPLVLGSVMFVRFQMSLPVLQPGEAHCGTGALGPVCIIVFGTPGGALIGAIAGSTLRHL